LGVPEDPEKVGPLEVDLFASRVTSQMDRFFILRVD
jgi:hypothetical protein